MISAGLSLYSKAAKKVIIKLAPVKKKELDLHKDVAVLNSFSHKRLLAHNAKNRECLTC